MFYGLKDKMKAIFRKSMQGIFPTDEEGRRLIESMPKDALCKVEYIRKRNYENHKRFFKFLEVAFDNQDFYENPEELRIALQMASGHFSPLVIQDKHGNVTTHYIPKSIAFEEMEEPEFQELFKKCIGAFLSRYGNGISEEQILRIVEFD